MFNVDGTDYPANSSSGGGALVWDPSTASNPSEHLVYVTLTVTEMTEGGP